MREGPVSEDAVFYIVMKKEGHYWTTRKDGSAVLFGLSYGPYTYDELVKQLREISLEQVEKVEKVERR